MLFRRISVILILNLGLLIGSGIFLLPVLAEGSEVEEENIEEVRAVLKEKLPNVRLTPDLPFYFLKPWAEKLKIKLTRNLERQFELRLQYAKKRLAEAFKVIEKEKYTVADKLLLKYETDIERIKADLNLVGKDTIDLGSISQKVLQNVLLESAVLKEAEEKSRSLDTDSQIRAAAMKKRGLAKAQETIKEMLTLKVSSEDYQERMNREGKPFKDKILDLFRTKKPEFVSPVGDEIQ